MEAPTSGLRLPGIENLEVVGRGGFATVYRGWQPALHRAVAVKVLERAHDDALSRFDKELAAMGALSGHRHVVPLYEAGTIGGQAYLVMPFLSGGTLEERYRQGALPPAEVVRIGIAMADALSAAHGLGLLHRDVKPGNILFTAYGEPQLTDFGVARFVDSTLTGGDIAATVGYAAPEVLTGSPASARSDIYSLGATLYAALQGDSPFAAGPEESLIAFAMRILHAQPPRIDSVGAAGLVQVIERAMAKDPADRFPGAAALGTALAASLRPPRSAPTPVPMASVPVGLASATTFPNRLPPAPRPNTDPQPSAAPFPRPYADEGVSAASANGALQERPAGPLPTARTHRRRAGWALAALAAIVALGLTLVVSSAGSSRQPTAGRSPATSVGRSPQLVGTRSSSIPAKSTASTTGSPSSTATTTTGAPTSSAPTSSAPASSAPTTVTPTTAAPTTSSATTDPAPIATAPAASTTPPAAAGGGAAQVISTIRDYYQMVNQHDLNQTFAELSPAYQQRLGFPAYQNFWNGISRVDVLSLTAQGDQAQVTLRYNETNGSVSTENAAISMVPGSQPGTLLIDSYQVD